MIRTPRHARGTTIAATLFTVLSPGLAAAQDAEICAALSAAASDPARFDAALSELPGGTAEGIADACGAVLPEPEIAAINEALAARGAGGEAADEAVAEAEQEETAPAQEEAGDAAGAEADADAAAQADAEVAEPGTDGGAQGEIAADDADATAGAGAEVAEPDAAGAPDAEAPAIASGADAAAESATLEADAAEITEEIDETIEDATGEVEEAESLETGDEAAEAVADAAEDVAPADEVADAEAIADEAEAEVDPAADVAANAAVDAEADAEAGAAVDAEADAAAGAEAADAATGDMEADAGAEAIADGDTGEDGIGVEPVEGEVESPLAQEAAELEAGEDVDVDIDEAADALLEDDGAGAVDAAGTAEAGGDGDAATGRAAVEETAEGEPAAVEGTDEAAAGVEAPQDDTAERTEAANAAPEIAQGALAAALEAAGMGDDDASADGAEAEAGEVETVTVTEETARSSTDEVAAREPAAEADDDEMSSFQKALLLGLGAVAVGSVLRGQGEVVQDTGDRVIVRQGDELRVLKDDDALLRRPGAEVSTRTYDDGTTLTTVDREDGSRVITVRAASGQVLRRTVVDPSGNATVLFDDTADIAAVDIANLEVGGADREVDSLRAALEGTEARTSTRAYSLQQIRQIRAVRQLAPQIELTAITFDTGSSAIRAAQADELQEIGTAMREAIVANPGEVFLVEGHTDAVGSAASNLALSDRRAESVALALTEFFDVPPENMVVQGYGESALKVRTGEAERANRRAAVRRITPLLNPET